ncbi:MAG: M23 family metallopeptidase [Actinobacteria bacterium]|nr:M23 family metallopeptidase [Actinomycetota bacterium]
MRSRRAPVAILWVAVAVAAAVLTAQALPAPDGHAQTPGFGGVLPVAPPVQPPREFAPFADAAGLTVRLPVEKPVGVLFHEAYSRRAVPMSPYGPINRNGNPSRFTPQDPPAPGRPYSVMASRGRGTAATSAVDIVAPAGTTLYSPVTGTVRAVRAYWLYGTYPDVRIEIEPDGAPDMRVVMIHLERVVNVAVGQHVIVSRTPIGRPRVLSFSSQTDEYTHVHDPHVHLEIKRGA